MTEPRRLRKRKSADERFRELIDYYYTVDDLYKLSSDERDRIRKQLARILRYGHRGLGVHVGLQHAINAHVVRRRQFNQQKARELLGLRLYNRAFKTQQYTQIDALERPDDSSAVTTPVEQLEAIKDLAQAVEDVLMPPAQAQ